MKSTSIFLLLLISIFSCKKKAQYFEIIGVVTNPITSSNVEGVTVIISSNTVSSNVYNASYSQLASTTTDSEGKFKFKLKYDKTVSYQIDLYKDKYFDETINFDYSVINPKTPYNVEYSITPEAILQFKIKNKTPFSEADELQYWYAGSTKKCPSCCTDTKFTLIGMDVEVLSTCKSIGNKYAKIYWTVKKNQHSNFYVDSVFCMPFQTTVFNLTY